LAVKTTSQVDDPAEMGSDPAGQADAANAGDASPEPSIAPPRITVPNAPANVREERRENADVSEGQIWIAARTVVSFVEAIKIHQATTPQARSIRARYLPREVYYTVNVVTTTLDLQPFTFIERWKSETPHELFFADGDTTFTFAELHGYASQLGAALRALGMQPGDTVALDMPAGLQTLFTAGLLHEAAVSMVHPEGRSTSQSREVNWLFTSEPALSPSAQRTVQVDTAFLRALGSQPPVEPRSFAFAHSLCRITFSSGTTGVPKAIPLTIEMVHHRAAAALELWPTSGAFLCSLGLASASGFHTLFAALKYGRLYLSAGEPEHNLAQITRYRVAAIKTSPVQLSRLIDASLALSATAREAALGSLRQIYVAGSVVPRTLREQVEHRTQAELVTLFGSTEAGRCAQRTLHSQDADLGNVGPAVTGTELQIVDADDHPLPIGESGVVRYRRQYQATEYLGDATATAATFRGGWFYTGDLGSLNDQGELILAGRTSELVNAGGVKLNLSDIDEYATAYEGVRDAASFTYGDANQVTRVGLGVVTEPSCDLPALVRSLQQHFGASAPTTLFKLPQLPRNAGGKLNRKALEQSFQQLGLN
jgi:acyl-coenzyme A synthetase/AMP-(fatty) acid ligase